MYNISYLATFINAELVLKETGNSAQNTIHSLASIDNADNGQLAYIGVPKYLSALNATNASAVIIKKEWLDDCPCTALVVDNPYLAFSQLSHLFKQKTTSPKGVHQSAVIAQSATIADDVKIGAYCVIGENAHIASGCILQSHCVVEDNVTIGSDSYLHTRVSLLEGSQIGRNVEIHSGCVIGVDGFANARDHNKKWHKTAQLGIVEIGNDVEIGGNTVIDRGAINNTIISDGVKIDNLVHIAHNIEIGEDSAIAACVAMAGSTKIGKRVLIGGNVGIAGHINITDDVMISGQSAVDKGVKSAGVYTSIVPLMEHKQWQRNTLWLRKLDKIVSHLNISLKQLKDNQDK